MFISQTTDFHFANYRFSFRKLQILISQTTDFHFANYRFPFRKLQIFISQTTDFHFANYRFPFRKVQISISQTTDSHFANYRFPFPFRFVPFRFANYSKPFFITFLPFLAEPNLEEDGSVIISRLFQVAWLQNSLLTLLEQNLCERLGNENTKRKFVAKRSHRSSYCECRYFTLGRDIDANGCKM